MKKIFTLTTLLALLTSVTMVAQDFPNDPGTLMVQLELVAYDDTAGDSIPGQAPDGAGWYAQGTTLTITAKTIQGYTFLYWEDNVDAASRQITLTESVVYTAVYEQLQYEVTFYDADGALLGSNMYSYGQTLSVPDAPTKDPDAQYTYVFKGWSPELQTSVTASQNYNAVYDTIVNHYVVNFWNMDNLLQTDSVAYGTMPAYTGQTPTREPAEGIEYTFSGWEPEISVVTDNADYYATFDEQEITYTITTICGSDTTIQTATYGEEVTITATELVGRYFTKWDDDNTEEVRTIIVTESATYTAVYGFDTYTVTFYDADETELSENTYHYGDSLIVPNNPDAKTTEEFTYTFTGWAPQLQYNVTESREYYAVYDTVVNMYTITFWNGDVVLQSDSMEYGSTPAYRGADPTRETQSGVQYEFDGWEPEIDIVTGNADYYASFTETEIIYTLIVYTGTDSTHTTGTYGEQMTITADEQERQHFTQWSDGNTDNPRTITLVSDTTFTAEYADSYVVVPVKANAWTFFTLPAMASGGTWNTDMLITDELADVTLGTYNGAIRAAAESGWETTSNNLEPGKGYIIYSTKQGDMLLDIYPTNVNTNPMSITLNAYEAAHEQNANWNFVGNPYYTELSASAITVEGLTDASATIWNGTGYDNEPLNNADLTFQPLQAFFIQTKGAGSMNIIPNGNGAPARRNAPAMVEENSRIDVHATADGYTDKSRVIFRTNSSIRYEAGRDASKFMTESAPIQMYFLDIDDVKCAQLVRPAGEDNIRLGYTLRKAGNIDINMPVYANDYELYDALTDRAYNLYESISIYSEAGTFNNRLMLRPIKKVATAISNSTADLTTGKLILNGQLYLVRDGKIYTVQGQEVK